MPKILCQAQSQNNSLKIFDDYSVEIECSQCHKVEMLPADNKHAQRLNKIPSAYIEYTCLDCWKKNQDEQRNKSKEARLDDIYWGQAYNSALMACFEEKLYLTDKEKFWNRLHELQEKFFEDIKGRQKRK